MRWKYNQIENENLVMHSWRWNYQNYSTNSAFIKVLLLSNIGVVGRLLLWSVLLFEFTVGQVISSFYLE